MPDLTVSQYARRREITRQAVERAINTGRLNVSIVSRDPVVLDAELADREWAAHTRVGRPPRAVAEERAKARAAAASPPRRRQAEAPPADDDGEAGEHPASADYNAERALKARADRKLAELNLAKASGTVIPVEAARRLWFGRWRGTRDRLLAVPPRLAAELAACTDPAEVEAKLDRALRAALDELPAEAPMPEAST